MYETESFIYSQDDLLGKGATSDVYKGISKKDCSFCALKVLKSNRHDIWKNFEQEMDILSKIKHENIVKILGMELDSCTGCPVLIMEFLNRGTLYDQLHEPQHLYGFTDHMFLSLLKDIAAALTHLQTVGIIHRDIKPNNILRSIVPEGREIYKLSDFGCATKVTSESKMESLVGTEEYVHPSVFEKVFINNGAQLASSEHLDQWSLGATLYHVATGNVPFQTKDGMRKNRECRLDMLKLKPSAVISAKENEHGDIIWEKELPSTCVLSKSLSKLIEKSLSHLLEINPTKAWIIPEFLVYAEKILKKIPVHVVQPSQERMEIFYLNPLDKIPHLKEAIAQQWDIPGHEQLLFHSGINLDFTFKTKSISEYPPTQSQHPFILIEKNIIKDVKKPVLIETISFPKEISSRDLSIANQICGEIYKVVRLFRHHKRITHCMFYTVGILNSMVGSEIQNKHPLCPQLLEKKCKLTLASINSSEDFEGYPNINEQYKKVKNLFKEATEILKNFKSKKVLTASIYYNVTERNYLEGIFKTVKAILIEHVQLFSKVTEDFQRWQSKKLETIQMILNFNKQPIIDLHFKQIWEYSSDGKSPQQTKELIESSKKEAKRLSNLNLDLYHLFSVSYVGKRI